jgi:prephenate dehydratase
MWSKPVYNERLGNYLFFIDTEGSQSLTKDIENDTKVFVLATLISSYFMFNSVGSID